MEPGENKEKKFSVGLFILIILLVIAAVACGYFAYRFISQTNRARDQWQASYAERVTPLPTTMVTPEATPTPVVTEKETETPTPTPTPEPEMLPTDNLQSAYACLIRGSDNAVLLDKNAKEKIYTASMSKVMTAVIALENLPDLNQMVTVYPEDIDPAYLAEASLAGFDPYETVTVRDLLYGVMLPSGAEACEALATTVTDSEETFVKMMNDKAAELGLTGTHYTNATGLHNEDHYTTCYDMSLLLQYAMKNETFREIVRTPVYTCTPTEAHPEGLTFGSTLYSNMDVTTFANGAVLEGGKTGTTDEAGKCLASAAVYYGEEYFLTTAQAPLDGYGSFEDAALVFGELTR